MKNDVAKRFLVHVARSPDAVSPHTKVGVTERRVRDPSREFAPPLAERPMEAGEACAQTMARGGVGMSQSTRYAWGVGHGFYG